MGLAERHAKLEAEPENELASEPMPKIDDEINPKANALLGAGGRTRRACTRAQSTLLSTAGTDSTRL